MFNTVFFSATKALGVGAIMTAAALMVGCSQTPDDGQGPKGLLDPTAVGNWNQNKGKPLVVPILTNLDILPEDSANGDFGNARPPKASDLVATAVDYKIGRNDLVTVSITDLVGTGVETSTTKRVSESGNVSLPLVGTVQVLGLTEPEAERTVAGAYANANLIQNANVQVVVTEARARTFSVMGAVQAPGQYAIVSSDFRVLDAMVLARGATSSIGIDTIYIVRKIKTEGEGQGADQPANKGDQAQPSPNVLQPQSDAGDTARPQQLAKAVYLQAEGEPAKPMAEGVISIDGQEKPVAGPAANATADQPAGADANQAMGDQPKAFDGFNDLKEPTDRHVIAIDYAALKSGQLKYNVVIQPDDMIIVPEPAIGEYYMAGHVLRTGAYSLTGRKITLKQAIAAASMFDALAIPSRTEIVRRLPGDREVFVRVDLDKIFAGQQSDIYLKPNDVVNVGTNAAAPFLAAIRGAFRFTYGFGFLYDRNFYDDNNINN